jgi:hypothetical protein
MTKIMMMLLEIMVTLCTSTVLHILVVGSSVLMDNESANSSQSSLSSHHFHVEHLFITAS